MKVGIAGHQDLGDAQAWCRGVLEELVRTMPVTHGYTNLGAGADQLFAEVLLAEGVSFTAVVPSEHYERAFASDPARERYAELLDRACERIVLAFATPSQEAFLCAGQRVVACAEALIAVWDGLAARGLGGTGDIVAFARDQGVPVVHCNPVARTVTDMERCGVARGP